MVYLLDGNALFPVAATLARIAAGAGRSLGIDAAPPVVVGIGHPHAALLDDRARGEDYTPPAPDLSDTGDRKSVVQGGADRFLDFVEGELKPLIEGRHRIDRGRQALVGHSYGGLLALHALFTRPESFQVYVAGSPSIWWNGGHILREKEAFIGRLRESPVRARLLVTVGALEQTPVARSDGAARDGLIRDRRMVDNARALAEVLQQLPPDAGLAVAYREFPGEHHYGAALPMLALAFGFLRQPAPAEAP